MSSLNNSTAANETSEDKATERTGVPQYQGPLLLRVFYLVLFSLIILTSLVGNSVVCKAVWNMPSRKRFSYHLVANMAFAEILSSLCLPIMLVWQFEGGDEVAIVHDIWCVVNPLQVVSMMVVTYSLAALAYYRYRVIVNPIPIKLSRKLKTVTIFCVWLLPTVVCVPLFIVNKFEHGHCKQQSFGNHFAFTYFLVKFALNFALPYLVMLASYGVVAWKLRQRISQKAAHSRNNLVTVVPSLDGMKLHTLHLAREETLQEGNQTREILVDVNNRRCIKSKNATDAEQGLLKMIFALILIFVICYFPYQAVFLWEHLADINEWKFEYHSLMWKLNFILTCLPSALHPVCYGTMNRFYAKAFSKIFLCKT